MGKPKHKFIIRYKSGAEVAVRSDELSIKWDTATGEAVEAKWIHMRPRPMAVGLTSIESVWQVS